MNANYKRDGRYERHNERGHLVEVREYRNGKIISRVTESWEAARVDRDHSGMARWLENREGNVWHIDGYGCDYSKRVDVKRQSYCSIGGDGLPTVQDLVENGTLTEKTCYEEVWLECKLEGARDLDTEKVMAFFKAKGYNVTEEAVTHNFGAWAMDMKSGYRDEENGYHLFTPCGCNPLSFTLTSLNDLCKDWQNTYIA